MIFFERARFKSLSFCVFCMLGLTIAVQPAPARQTEAAPPPSDCPPEISDALYRSARILLGEWTEPAGGVIRVSIAADGTLKATIVQSSERMRAWGYTPGMIVLRQMNLDGPGVTWLKWAAEGEHYHALHTKEARRLGLGPAGWFPDGYVFIHEDRPDVLRITATLESRMANYEKFYRRGGPTDRANACETARDALARGSPAERLAAAQRYAETLSASDNRQERQAAATLAALAEREQLASAPQFDRALRQVERSRNPNARDLSVVQLAAVNQAAHFAAMVGNRPMTSEQIATLRTMARNAALLRDDLINPGGVALDDNGTAITNLLNTIRGVAKIQEGFDNGQNTEVLEGIRNLTGAVDATGGARLSRIADMPMEVASAISDVSTRGFGVGADALNGLVGQMRGEPGATERMLAASRRMQETISGEAYGRAMLNAIAGRLFDRIPAARALLDYLSNTRGYTPSDAIANLACER